MRPPPNKSSSDSRPPPRGPQRIGDIVSAIFARQGYGRLQEAALLAEAWRQVAGEGLAQASRAGAVRRGVLEVVVVNSVVLQELAFRKRELLSGLKSHVPDQKIADLRFRVGPLG